jgi:hypothetical protein
VVATIVEVDPVSHQQRGAPMAVDFNPQSLRLAHTAIGPPPSQTPASPSTEKTSTAHQQTGYTTSLTMDLLFDTSREGSDVRQRTLVLVALTRPQTASSSNGKAVRFSWGSFLFVGYIDSLGETIDLFSPDGVPLRAAVAVSMRGLAERDQRPGGGGAGAGGSLGISAGVGGSFGASAGASASFGAAASAGAGASFGAAASAGAGASFGAAASAGAGASFGAGASATAVAAIGTTPLTVAMSGDTVQSLAAKAGVSWKAVATANGIDNPRLLPPGTVLDVRIGR